jgi:effector-binding domain-containing protein
MIDSPQIVHTAASPIAVLHLTIPRSEIQKVMGPGIQELMATIAAQGITPTGPWFTHHLRMQPDTFDFEIGVPVSAPIVAAGRVRPSERPALRVARAVYRGPYEGLGNAWGEVMTWIAAQGLEHAADLWETYAAGPESGSDPAAWQTVLERPLSG